MQMKESTIAMSEEEIHQAAATEGSVVATSPTSAVTNVYDEEANDNKEITSADFDDDMDDGPIQEDETMQEEEQEEVTCKKSNPSSSSSNTAVVFSPELLKNYYARLFPFDLLHSWLAYNPATTTRNKNNNSHHQQQQQLKKNAWIFSRREFSMTIEPTPGEEIYIRYQSFTSQEELTQAILKRRPTKIDLGAIFTHPPKDNKTLSKGTLKPVQRELVFDIDLTDYDDIRHCGCTGAAICSKCWVFMTMAVEVMDCGLKEDFGFEHVAWFYSGRRGIHAWICDESARKLTNEARNAVATYFEVRFTKCLYCMMEYLLHVDINRICLNFLVPSVPCTTAVPSQRKQQGC
jgi:DNA primase small subunit